LLAEAKAYWVTIHRYQHFATRLEVLLACTASTMAMKFLKMSSIESEM
jgi:hypothetical protein